MNVYIRMLIYLTAMAILIVPSCAQPTSFVINGWVFYEDGTTPCNDPMVNITNPDTSAEWQAETNTSSSHYQIVLISGTDLNATEILRFDVTGGTNTSVTDHTISVSEVDDGGIFDLNITLGPTSGDADLIVESITPNCGGYLFGNESNNISAVIKNIGGADAGASGVSFVLSDGYNEIVAVPALDTGNSTTVSITDPTIRSAGAAVTITVTADCNAEVAEGNESNNATVLDVTVANNGYKGKTYTGGSNMTTWKSYDLNGSLIYSLGDSYYRSGYSGWPSASYTANWTASDIPVPAGATIEEVRLYVPYCFDYQRDMPDNLSLKFNGNAQILEKHYTDRKSYGSWDNPYGMLTYNVTDDFDPSGNIANLTNSNPKCCEQKTASIRGMVLMVIYEDATEPRRLIYVGEEFDLLYGGSGKCTTPEEATAWAPITGLSIDTAAVASATLITVAPGAGPTEGELLFNGQVWTDVWNYAGSSQIGIDERDVASYLEPTDNLVGFQSNGDYMEASNVILVVTFGSIPGDVNGDGYLTTADATIVLQMAVRGEYSDVADVSGDGAVTSLDALMILQAVGTES